MAGDLTPESPVELYCRQCRQSTATEADFCHMCGSRLGASQIKALSLLGFGCLAMFCSTVAFFGAFSALMSLDNIRFYWWELTGGCLLYLVCLLALNQIARRLSRT